MVAEELKFKTEQRVLFQALDFPIPTGKSFEPEELLDEERLLLELAKVIIANPTGAGWILKIDQQIRGQGKTNLCNFES